VFWNWERVVAALRRLHRQAEQAPTSSDAWAAVSSRLAHGTPRVFPSAAVVLRHFGSFRAAWAWIGVDLPLEGARWTEHEDASLRAMAGVMPRRTIARSLGRSANAVKARLGRLRGRPRHRRSRAPAAPLLSSGASPNPRWELTCGPGRCQGDQRATATG
jgi:hypothetical protein